MSLSIHVLWYETQRLEGKRSALKRSGPFGPTGSSLSLLRLIVSQPSLQARASCLCLATEVHCLHSTEQFFRLLKRSRSSDHPSSPLSSCKRRLQLRSSLKAPLILCSRPARIEVDKYAPRAAVPSKPFRSISSLSACLFHPVHLCSGSCRPQFPCP